MSSGSRSSSRSETADPGFEDFIAALTRLVRVVRRVRGDVSRHAPGATLSLSQFHLLDALYDKGTLRVNEIAEAAEVAPPTATRMLAGLAAKGIVDRVPASDDHRAVNVTLTAAGRLLMAEKRARVHDNQRRTYEGLQPHERDHARVLLDRLADLIDTL